MSSMLLKNKISGLKAQLSQFSNSNYLADFPTSAFSPRIIQLVRQSTASNFDLPNIK